MKRALLSEHQKHDVLCVLLQFLGVVLLKSKEALAVKGHHDEVAVLWRCKVEVERRVRELAQVLGSCGLGCCDALVTHLQLAKERHDG